MKFKEPEWVGDFREYIGLEVRLLEVREECFGADGADVYKYGVFSPSGVQLFYVASYNDSDYIGSSNSQFCLWKASNWTPDRFGAANDL